LQKIRLFGLLVLFASLLVGCNTLREAEVVIPTPVPTLVVQPIPVVQAEPAQPYVFFVEPLAGATVPITFTVSMSATGLIVEPAGEVHEGAGHLHILVDTDFIPAGEAIPKDEQHLHYGKGQITATLALTPGTHTLRLQFANGAHIALEGEQYRDSIQLSVQ
jgi:hypothetical protein